MLKVVQYRHLVGEQIGSVIGFAERESITTVPVDKSGWAAPHACRYR